MIPFFTSAREAAMKAIALCFLILLITVSVASSSENADIQSILTSDGRLDLDKAHQSGIEGSLNSAGLTFSIDPQTGEPILKATSESRHPDDIY